MRTSRRPSQTEIWSGKVIDGQVRPGMLSTARNSRGKPADFRIHVGLAALFDQFARARRGQDFGADIGGGAKDAHGVIVRQQDVFDRLVGDLLHPVDHLPRHHRRGLGVDHHHAVVADDDPGIRVALGGEGVEVGPDGIEGDGLVGQIAGRGETRAHRDFLPVTSSIT